MNKFLVDYYEDAISGRQIWRQPLRTRVENAITPRLPHGTMNISNIASDLGMSVRTLSRRLADEGQTFSTILEELRSDLANRYLQNSSLSISQIAWLLGYSEVSSFAHAFQRWTGKLAHLRTQADGRGFLLGESIAVIIWCRPLMLRHCGEVLELTFDERRHVKSLPR